MRYICFLLFFISTFPALAQTEIRADTVSKKMDQPEIRIRCHAVSSSDSGPLFVVDDEPMVSLQLGYLNPDDVDSITILKGSQASALYGSRGANGAIIIRTKKTVLCSFYARDGEDGTMIPGATFTFSAVDGSETFRFVADREGRVNTAAVAAGRKYKLVITSVGYKEFNTFYTRQQKKSLQCYTLARDIKENAEVVVIGYRRSSHCPGECGGNVDVYTQHLSKDSVSGNKAVSEAHLYPNPVIRGASIKLEAELEDDPSVQVKITSISGAVMRMVNYTPAKGLNRIEVPVAAEWAAGVYFVQLTGQNGKLLKQNKLIIQ